MRWLRFVLVPLLLILAGGLVTTPRAAAQEATPRPGSTATALAESISSMPAWPLSVDGGPAMVTFADLEAQAAAIQQPWPLGGPDAGRALVTTSQGLMMPSDAPRMGQPEWRETFGFGLGDIDQSIEYNAPPLVLTILRGRFDANALPALWEQQGYTPVESNGVTFYSIRDDFELDLSDPGSRLAMAHLNNIALLDPETLVYSSARHGIEDAIAVWQGQQPSLADDTAVGPLVRAVPGDLVTAMIVPGAALIGSPDPLSVLEEMGTPGAGGIDAVATRVAAHQEQTGDMPPVAAALLGMTPGGPLPAATLDGSPVAVPEGIPDAHLIAAVTVASPEAAAAVIEGRLATQALPGDGPSGGAPLAEVFPEWTVAVAAGEPVVVVDLLPRADLPRTILVNLLFQRQLTFLAWTP